jgi:hypothetical protein
MTPPLARRTTRREPRASIQATTLDLLWIDEGIVCFAAGRAGVPVLRAILALDGPAHTPRALAAANPGALDGYRALLSQLDHALQVLVRAVPADTASEAARWETRAAVLPGPLAELAREHATWVRRELAGLGLLVRRAYVVVPADEPVEQHPIPAVVLHRGRPPTVSLERARVLLRERCARLSAALEAAGVGARRLDDLALAPLYRACWNPTTPGADRQDRDLAAAFGRRP